MIKVATSRLDGQSSSHALATQAVCALRARREFDVVMSRLFAFAHDEPLPAQMLERLLGIDVKLSQGVLRGLERGAFGEPTGSLPSIKAAVQATASAYVQKVALVVSVDVLAADCLRGLGVDPRQFTRHALATAEASSRIAAWSGVAPALPFSVGLLHNLGALGLAAWKGEEYRRLLLGLQNCQVSLCAAEQALMGTTHIEIGRQMLSHYEFPEVFLLAAAHISDPLDTIRDPLTRAVAIGAMLAQQLVCEVPTGSVSTFDCGSLSAAHVGREELERLSEGVIATIARYDRFC